MSSAEHHDTTVALERLYKSKGGAHPPVAGQTRRLFLQKLISEYAQSSDTADWFEIDDGNDKRFYVVKVVLTASDAFDDGLRCEGLPEAGEIGRPERVQIVYHSKRTTVCRDRHPGTVFRQMCAIPPSLSFVCDFCEQMLHQRVHGVSCAPVSYWSIYSMR